MNWFRFRHQDETIRDLRGQVDYLKQEIEDRKREHGRERDDWRGELERLHALLAQKEQARAPTEHRVDTYLSQLLPGLFIAAVGGSAIAGFFTVENTTVQWAITVLGIVAIVSLVTMNRLSKRVLAMDEESRKEPTTARRHLRLAVLAAGLYVLGVVLFIAVTVLYLVH